MREDMLDMRWGDFGLTGIELFADGSINKLKGTMWFDSVYSRHMEFTPSEFIDIFDSNKESEPRFEVHYYTSQNQNNLNPSVKIKTEDNGKVHMITTAPLYNIVENTDQLSKIMENVKLVHVDCNSQTNTTSVDLVKKSGSLKEAYLVNSLTLEVINKNKQLTLNKLVENGAKQISDTQVQLDLITLRSWINLSNSFWIWCVHREIKEEYNDIIISIDRNFYKNSFTYNLNNTHINKLKAWVNKAKMLGILDGYTLDEEKLTLVKYTGIEKNPLLPPVRIIKDGCFRGNDYVRELNIPDTVEILDIDFGMNSKIEKIKLGLNTFNCHADIVNYLKTINSIDLANVETKLRLNKLIKTIKLRPNTQILFEARYVREFIYNLK